MKRIMCYFNAKTKGICLLEIWDDDKIRDHVQDADLNNICISKGICIADTTQLSIQEIYNLFGSMTCMFSEV